MTIYIVLHLFRINCTSGICNHVFTILVPLYILFVTKQLVIFLNLTKITDRKKANQQGFILKSAGYPEEQLTWVVLVPWFVGENCWFGLNYALADPGGRRRHAPREQDQFLSFSHTFSPKSVCVRGWHPPNGSAPPNGKS